MAKKTKTLKAAEPLEFFKYDPVIDGEQTFNIDLALNENWDKVKSKFDSQDTEIEAIKSEVENIDVSWEGITGKPSTFPASEHKHTKAQITDFPTTLPANGGNADTVDGSHAWQMQTLNAAGGTHGSEAWVAQMQYNKDADGRFKLFVGDGTVHQTKVDYATNTSLLSGYSIDQIKKMSGDYINKTLDFIPTTQLHTSNSPSFTYTNAKGGFVKLNLNNASTQLTTITVDGVVVLNAKSPNNVFNLANTSMYELYISFNTTFTITNVHTSSSYYYIQGQVFLNK